VFCHDRLAAVAAFRHARVDGDLAEERHAGTFRQPLPAAVTEDLVTLAVVAD
jgi:hypothetical protein